MSDITYSEATENLEFDASENLNVVGGRIGEEDSRLDSQASLLHNFGVASLLVVAGVVISGFLLTSERGETGFSLPALPVAAWQNEAAAGNDSESFSDLADQAFASGRITEPANDNALYYYHQAVLVNAADRDARAGLDRVVAYVIGDAEAAVYQSDWAQARRSAEYVLAFLPENAGAASVIERTEKFESIEKYSRLAVNQLATDRLLSPRGDNALSSYRRILRIDPGNSEATVGIQTVAQRLVAKSQAAAIAGDFEASAKYTKQARDIAPNLGSVDQAAKLTDQFALLTRQKAAEAESEAEAAERKALALETEAIEAKRIFSVSELTVARSVAPSFPRRAGTAEGWVELNFQINTRGEVFNALVVRSSDDVFESAALAAIKKWRFAPHIEGGVATTIRSGVRFSFKQ